MCNVNPSDHDRRNVRVSISGNVSPLFKKYLKRSRSANVATEPGRAKSMNSSHEHAEAASPTDPISLLSAMIAITGSQPTRRKPTKKAGSNTPGNDVEQWKHVEHLLSMGLWDQAEEAIVKLIKGKR
jgi:hypothetical protein